MYVTADLGMSTYNDLCMGQPDPYGGSRLHGITAKGGDPM